MSPIAGTVFVIVAFAAVAASGCSGVSRDDQSAIGGACTRSRDCMQGACISGVCALGDAGASTDGGDGGD